MKNYNKPALRLGLFALISLLFTVHSFGQNSDPQPTFWQQVRFGGGLGMSFGDGFTSITVAPSAIYEVSEQFATGIGLNFTYNKLRNNYNATIVGGSVIGLYNPIPELQVSAEFEELNVSRNFDSNLGIEDDNYWYPALFLGAGYRTGNVTFGIRYDVLYDEDRSIYADPYIPFVRVYF